MKFLGTFLAVYSLAALMPVFARHYEGGSDDGYDLGEASSQEVEISIYSGGDDDGYDSKESLTAEEVTADFPQGYGGDDDGYDMEEYESYSLIPGYVVPENVAIDEVYVSSVTLSWTKEGGAEGYIVKASSVSSAFSVIHQSSSTAEINMTTLTVTGLFSNTTYWFRVGNLYGGTTLWMESPVSFLSTCTLANPVTGAVIYAVNEASVTLNWAAHPESPQSESCSGYIVQASSTNFGVETTGGTVYSTYTYTYALSTLTVTGLTGGTTYWFRVGSLNWNSVPNYVTVGSTETLPPTGAGTGTAAFAPGDSPQEINSAAVVEQLTVTGDGTFTLTGVRVTIPSGWNWAGSASDISLSGEGFNPAPDVSVEGNVVTIGTTTSASITDVDTGIITFANLTPTACSAEKFTVETKGSGGFSEIASSPGIVVYGKLVLGTDGTYNPPAGDGITPNTECLIAAFTLNAQGEGITISSFTVIFSAVGGGSLGDDFTSFKIYKESNPSPDGWDGSDLILRPGAVSITGTDVYVYEPTQNETLGAGETVTYYLTVFANINVKVQEGISVQINVSSVNVSGNISSVNFANTGSFTGNEIIRGGVAEPAFESVLRLGQDRHTFYDGSFYWAFYINSDQDVVYSTSANGVTWGGEVKVNNTAAGFSSMGIHEDGVSVFVTYTSGSKSYVRKITISTKSMGAETEITTEGHNDSQIIKDSGGFLWRKGRQ